MDDYSELLVRVLYNCIHHVKGSGYSGTWKAIAKSILLDLIQVSTFPCFLQDAVILRIDLSSRVGSLRKGTLHTERKTSYDPLISVFQLIENAPA